ncbi:MAG TPA: anti-sigma factor domain-containing protein [Clostridia bacterium]|nr:anti-sigma factor domain-containing protein [Clostridia bacterium]
MKAIVAEIDKKQMIVLTDKGDFIKVKRQLSLGIGDEIELKPQKINLTYRRLASIAACFLACIFLSTGVYAYYTPYSYVSVDINPSIALSLNRFERVISVNPLNEDAVNLIKNTKGLKNKDIDDALSAIIKSASEEGYIDEQMENQIMVVVSAKNLKQEEELADMVTIAATNQLSKVNNNFGVMVEKASVKSYKEALSNKMSPGKEILADRLREVSPEIKDEEVRNMSVREVVHLINEGRKAVMAAEKDKDKKDKEEQSITNKDSDKKEDKEAAKFDSKAKKDNNGSDKPKPAAAVKKDNASTSNKGNNDKNKKEDKVKEDKENEGNGDKDSEQENVDKDKQNNGADGQVNNDEAKDKDNSGERDGKDKENKDGKKGD